MNSNKEVKTTFRNKLINRNMKHQSIIDRSNGIWLRNSFYNDENLDYLGRSNLMLKTSKSYQAKTISQSIRKRINTEKVEQIIRKKGCVVPFSEIGGKAAKEVMLVISFTQPISNKHGTTPN
jgi:hypothetical protein